MTLLRSESKEHLGRVADVEIVFFLLLKGNTVNYKKDPGYREGSTRNLIPKDMPIPFKIFIVSKTGLCPFSIVWKGHVSVLQRSASPIH